MEYRRLGNSGLKVSPGSLCAMIRVTMSTPLPGDDAVIMRTGFAG
jgi:aryl-alcohol dehydrogenase-like predicted oxidoreductase